MMNNDKIFPMFLKAREYLKRVSNDNGDNSFARIFEVLDTFK